MTRKTKLTLGTVAGILLLIVLGAIGVWDYVSAPYEGAQAQWLYLPQATTTEAALGDSLRSTLGERTARRVMTIYRAAAPDSARAYGAYLIEPGTSAKDIARRLVNHRQTPVRLTFNNIRTLAQLADHVSHRMDFDAADFIAACDSVLPAAGFRGREQYAAAFLPDTYEFYWTSSVKLTVERMLDARNRFWTDDRRARARSMGINPVQAATLASIAEEETNDREERATVARLYLNRVNRNMKLQADPTVKFALGDFSLRRIRAEHLKAPSPYNTYLVAGLPPGPIRIADSRTIDALLNSKPNNYIYMCAKEDFSGRHNFAADYATHQANARRYRRALDARNIK